MNRERCPGVQIYIAHSTVNGIIDGKGGSRFDCNVASCVQRSTDHNVQPCSAKYAFNVELVAGCEWLCDRNGVCIGER